MQAIVHTAIRVFLLDSREALAIWAALALLAVLAFLLLTATARREWSGVARAGASWARMRRSSLEAQTADLRRYADELAVAARRAALTAERRHDEWLAAQRAVAEAWTAFEAADATARRVFRAAVIEVPQESLTPNEVAARERHLHRAVTEAYHRGDLTIEQLMDAVSGRNGWNPCRHPADQETILCRLARQHRLYAYQAASTAERIAWHDTDLATAARRSLEDEAFTAAARAEQADRQLAQLTRQRHSRGERTTPLGTRPGIARIAVR